MTEREQDQEWVASVQDGDDAAFEALMDRYQAPILAFIYRMTSKADEAQDIAQEVFVRAYRAIRAPRFHLKKASLSTWLFQIARNAAIDALRRQTRKPTDSLEKMPGMRDALPDPGALPDQQVAANELQDRIAHALRRLPEDQRTAIVLSVYHDQSHADIAAILHCSTKSIETRIYRARKKLAAWLL